MTLELDLKTRHFTDAAIHLIAEYLRGTTNSLSDACNAMERREEEMTYADCLFLDDIVFECTACNWWHEISECEESEAGEWICRDCKGDA